MGEEMIVYRGVVEAGGKLRSSSRTGSGSRAFGLEFREMLPTGAEVVLCVLNASHFNLDEARADALQEFLNVTFERRGLDWLAE
jgi:hypothetical protein